MATPSAALNSGAIDKVRILGAKLNMDMRQAVTEAKISMSTDQVTQLDITFTDSQFDFLEKGQAVIGTRVDLDDFKLQISAVETMDVSGAEGFMISCRPVVVFSLKNRRGAKVMSNISPSDFVKAECKAVGAGYKIQSSARRKQVARDVAQKGQTYDNSNYPSSWTTFQRLAGELGYICYEVANTVYFGKPSWILKNASQTLGAYYRTGDQKYWTLDIPSCRKSVDSKQTTISFTAPGQASQFWLPGKACAFKGVTGFTGTYLINSVSYDLLNSQGDVDVDIETPEDPTANPPSTSTSSSSGSTTRRNTKSANDFVYWAQKQMGDKYVYGAAVSSSTNPTQFDCSSLVKWAASMVGVYMPRTSEEQIDYCTSHHTRISLAKAKVTRGALLHHPGHSAISLGNGRTIEAANSRVGVVSYGIGDRFTSAGLLPGMRY